MSRSFSLVEIAVATLVLTVALLSLLAALTQGADVRMSARRGETAAQLIRAELERYRALPMSQVMTTIGGASQGVQPSVTVAQPDLPAGSLTVQILTEQECVAAFGLAQAPDLDGDGDPATSDASSYGVVPVRFTMTWDAGNTTRTRQLVTFFYPKSTTVTGS